LVYRRRASLALERPRMLLSVHAPLMELQASLPEVFQQLSVLRI